jgi:hypothetical protein
MNDFKQLNFTAKTKVAKRNLIDELSSDEQSDEEQMDEEEGSPPETMVGLSIERTCLVLNYSSGELAS